MRAHPGIVLVLFIFLSFFLASASAAGSTTPGGPPPPTNEGPPNNLTTGLCTDKQWLCIGVASVLAAAFLGLIVIGRYFWVVEPKNARLRAMKRSLEARVLSASEEEISHDKRNAINGLLNNVVVEAPLDHYVANRASEWTQPSAKGLIPGAHEGVQRKMLFAFTGKQLGAWRQLHEAERLLFDALPNNVAHGQAMVALNRLNRLPNVPLKLRVELNVALDASNHGKPSAKLISLVEEAKALIYEEQDRLFEEGAMGQNKAFWLVFAAYFSVLSIGFVFDGAPILLVAGAIGGLLARLRKAVKVKTSIFDYGISWGVLFLTPLTGALTGWIGVAFMDVIQQWGFIAKDQLAIDLFVPNVHTLLVAFVFGLSATLFDVFAERFENVLNSSSLSWSARFPDELDLASAAKEREERSNKEEESKVHTHVETTHGTQPEHSSGPERQAS